MSRDLLVRTATSDEEVAQAKSIRRAVFVQEQRIPAYLDADGLDGQSLHVLAFAVEMPVATGRLCLTSPTEATIARIAVLPPCRGRGIGQRVVAHLEQLAIDEGVRSVELHPHEHLEDFYTRLGYQVAPGREVVGEHSLITMRKTLRHDD